MKKKLLWTYVLYATVLIVTAALLYLDYLRNRELTLNVLKEQAIAVVHQLNLVVKVGTDQINGLKYTAEGFLENNPPTSHSGTLEIEKLLKKSEYFEGFALDDPPDYLRKEAIGNLNGEGDPATFDRGYLRELEMAFSLNTDFQAAIEAIPSLGWVYYTSKRSFQNIFPWVSTSENHWTSDLHDLDFYRLGLPRVNPGRTLFWTKPYIDTYGKGPMVTGGAPVYDGEEFIGTVALDFTLDYLDDFLRLRKPELGTGFIAMNHDLIIAHPSAVRTEGTILRLIDVLPEDLKLRDVQRIIPGSRFARAGEGFFLERDIEGAPFNYVVHVSGTDLQKYTLSTMVLDFVVGVLLLMMVFAFERVRRSKEEINAAKETLEQLSTKISKYLSPQVFDSIFSGQLDVKVTTQRKKLTVFFSDIKDFTETTEGLQPEDLAYLINSYFNEMSLIALKHGATIDKFIGDAVLLFFGDPDSDGIKNDAIACVTMAIEMQRRMRELREKWRSKGFEDPFSIRIGINTGFCNVGNFGSKDRMDYTIIGGEVNLAARLENKCDPDGILMSYETYALVRDSVKAEKREPISMKGIRKEVNSYAVTNIFDGY